MKIYQDGLAAGDKVGRKIVEQIARAGSENYELVARLLERGAFLVETEDFSLVKAEYNRLVAITQAKSIMRKLIAVIRYKLAKKGS
jgi:hypothetical protein